MFLGVSRDIIGSLTVGKILNGSLTLLPGIALLVKNLESDFRLKVGNISRHRAISVECQVRNKSSRHFGRRFGRCRTLNVHPPLLQHV